MLVKLIDLVNSVKVFLSQKILLRWLTFLLWSQTMILIGLLFWIYFFLLTLVFVPQWISLVLIMFLSQFPLTFYHIHNRIPHFITLLMAILVLIVMAFVIIWEMFHGKTFFNSVPLLLLVNFVSHFRLKFMCKSLIESIRSSLTHLHGFQLLVLLP